MSGLLTMANWLAGMLEPAEREAALGDLAETRATGPEAALEVGGLVARRQLSLWKDWKPWAVALGLISPSVLLLSGAAAWMSHLGSIYAWLYVVNWDSTYWTNAGARADLIRYGGIALAFSTAMAVWAWAMGFAAGSIARRSAPVLAVLAALVLFLVEPRSRGFAFAANDAAIQSALGRVAPVAFRILAVLTPMLWGLAKGAKLSIYAQPKPARSWLLAAALAMTVAFDWAFRFHRLP